MHTPVRRSSSSSSSSSSSCCLTYCVPAWWYACVWICCEDQLDCMHKLHTRLELRCQLVQLPLPGLTIIAACADFLSRTPFYRTWAPKLWCIPIPLLPCERSCRPFKVLLVLCQLSVQHISAQIMLLLHAKLQQLHHDVLQQS